MVKLVEPLTKNSLAFKCFKVLFGLYSFCTLIITLTQMYATYTKAEKDLIKEVNTTYQSLSGALSLGINELDDEIIMKLIEGLAGLPQTEGVIINSENESYISTGIKQKNKRVYKGKIKLIKIIEKDIYWKDPSGKEEKEFIGKIKIYRSSDAILIRVKDGFYYLILAAFIKTICLGFIFFWVFKKWLITPLSNIAFQAKGINLENLNKISLGFSSSEKNELYVLENSINFMIENIEISKEEITQKNEELSDNYKNLFDLSQELQMVNQKLEDSNLTLKDKVEEATQELNFSLKKTEAMLLNVNKAIFVTDPQGVVQSPVSKHCETLFGKNIVGENGLKLLFFHLKDKSKEKELLLSAWKHIFGQEESQYLSVESNFPKNVIHPDKDKKSGRHLNISYAPLLDKNKNLDRLMFLVEDKTKEILENLETKKSGHYYHIIMDILPIKDKELLAQSLANYLKECVFFLEDLVGPEGKKEKLLKDMDALKSILLNGQKVVFQPLLDLQNIVSSMIEKTSSPSGGPELFSVNAITQIIESLNAHVEVLNILNANNMGPKVSYQLPTNFESSIQEKIQDLDRLMVNILEYVFLVRKVEDLNKEKITNAPKKAMLYSEYDRIIDLIMKRTRLISYLLKVVGKTEKSEVFYSFSELLKQMPSKDKLTEAALVNHLINPYVDIQKI